MSSRLQNSFSEFCNNNKFEINKKQTEILNSLEKFIFSRNKLLNFFQKKKTSIVSIFMEVLGLVKP